MTEASPSGTTGNRSPFAPANVRLFIAFRIFFNCRFYYPVFTILFLDFGLTLNQFAILNAVWAAAIVLFEVPSGALADILGRKNLLVFTGVLMVVEIGLLCVVPLGNTDLLFGVFLINRVLSGIAEASASGADEALAFDTLKAEGMSEQWGRVLERMMRYKSIVFIVASITGASVYDPRLMASLFSLIGIDLVPTQELTLRFPLYLTLGMALMTLYCTLRMEEVPNGTGNPGSDRRQRPSALEALGLTFKAGAWILATPFAFLTIAAGMLFDHVIRMLITLNSQYFRVIEFPEATFGIIGSAMALMGLVIPRLARKLSEKWSPARNLMLLAVLTTLGLWGTAPAIPYWGLAPMVLLNAVMYLSGFFISHYLNHATPSHQRATVLSFKGLSYNLAYGLVGIMYSGLLGVIGGRITPEAVAEAAGNSGAAVFIASLGYFPGYFLALFTVLLIVAALMVRGMESQQFGAPPKQRS